MLNKDLFRSSYLRYTIGLAGMFTIAYFAAGLITLNSISANLGDRVRQSAALASANYKDLFETAGETALIDQVRQDIDPARNDDYDDEVVWLGTKAGKYVAGTVLADPGALTEGQYSSGDLGLEEDEPFILVERQFGDYRLITGRSLEEADDLLDDIVSYFMAAFIVILSLSLVIGLFLSQRAQRRIDAISGTLDAVASGKLQTRVKTEGRDDLALLANRVDGALDRLQKTVEGIQSVSVAIAHDLRTPLNRLGIQITRLEDVVPETKEAATRFETTRATMDELVGTFDALLRIAQIEAGARRQRFESVALSDIAKRMEDAYSAVAEEAGQRLQLNLTENGATLVLGDKDLLTQLTANLIENAIRYAGADATIRIEAGATAHGVWFSVTDNGKGLTDEERARATQRFFRGDTARTSPGNGLGLALVEAIATLHGAKLKLEDAAPGLRVRLEFPTFSEALKSRA